jgi:hypothetical protein
MGERKCWLRGAWLGRRECCFWAARSGSSVSSATVLTCRRAGLQFWILANGEATVRAGGGDRRLARPDNNQPAAGMSRTPSARPSFRTRRGLTATRCALTGCARWRRVRASELVVHACAGGVVALFFHPISLMLQPIDFLCARPDDRRASCRPVLS